MTAQDVIKHLVDLLNDPSTEFEPSKCEVCREAYEVVRPHQNIVTDNGEQA